VDAEFAKRVVRKFLGKGASERKPSHLTISLDSPEQYSFVGECYVHNMTADEGFEHQREHGNMLKVFHPV
jgi:hypothetical protein